MPAMTNTVMTGLPLLPSLPLLSSMPSSSMLSSSMPSSSMPSLPSSSNASSASTPYNSSSMSESNSNYNTNYNMDEYTPASADKDSETSVEVRQNPLRAIPAATVSSERGQRGGQRGGNPWAAFLLSATPTVALLGAYSLLPNKRSSGLGPAK